MQEVVFDGVHYIKAKELARELGYTADYLGQLCRSGKVDARLVGRSWFVSRASVLAHQEQRYEQQRFAAKSHSNTDISNEIRISRVDVQPVLSKHTRKNFYAHTAAAGTSLYLRTQNPHYEDDESPLVPQIDRANHEIKVDLSDARAVAVTTDVAQSVSFRPESLPVVYLGGTLKINSVENDIEDEVAESIKTPPLTQVKEGSTKKVITPTRLPVAVGATQPSHFSQKSVSSTSGSVPTVQSITVPVRPLEVIASRPVAISVVLASVAALVILGARVVLEIGDVAGAKLEWQSALIWQLFK